MYLHLRTIVTALVIVLLAAHGQGPWGRQPQFQVWTSPSGCNHPFTEPADCCSETQPAPLSYLQLLQKRWYQLHADICPSQTFSNFFYKVVCVFIYLSIVSFPLLYSPPRHSFLLSFLWYECPLSYWMLLNTLIGKHYTPLVLGLKLLQTVLGPCFSGAEETHPGQRWLQVWWSQPRPSCKLPHGKPRCRAGPSVPGRLSSLCSK